MDNTSDKTCATCGCPHHKMIPGFIFLIGLLFLGGELSWWSMGVVNMGWPILLMLIGLQKMFKGMCKCC